MKYDELKKQFFDKEFGDMRFSVFNFIEEDGYVTEVSVLNGEKYGIEDFSFMILDIPDEDKRNIKTGDIDTVMWYKEFKYHVENECQKKIQLGVFIMTDIGVVVVVKPKAYDLSDFNKN